MGLGPRTASKIFDLLRDFTVGTFNAVSKSGEWAVNAAETGIGKFRPGTTFAPVIREPAKFVAGSAVVGGVAGAGLGATEQTAKEILTKYAPDLLPDDMKVKDDKPFAERFGEKVIPSSGDGALFLPALVWDVSSGIYNYVTGNTTGKPKETPPVTSVAQPPATPDPTATAAEAAAKKAAQEQADKANALEAEKKKVEAAKQTEADRMVAEKAKRDTEFEKVRKEEEARLAQQQNDQDNNNWWSTLSSFFTDENGNFSITAGLRNLVAFANASNITWLKAIVNPIAGFCAEHPNLVKGAAGVLGGLGLFGRSMDALSNPALLKNPGFLAKTAIYAGMVKASTEGYGAPGDDFSRGYGGRYGMGGGKNHGLDTDLSSAGNFNRSAVSASYTIPPSAQPQQTVGQPVYHYGEPKQDTSLAASFERPASGITPVAPPVSKIPNYDKPPENWLTYDIDRAG